MSTFPPYQEPEALRRDDDNSRKFLIGLFRLALEPGPEDADTSNLGYWNKVVAQARQNSAQTNEITVRRVLDRAWRRLKQNQPLEL